MDGIEYRHPAWFNEPGVDTVRFAVDLPEEHECWPSVGDCEFWVLADDVDEVAEAAKMPSRSECVATKAYRWGPDDPMVRFGGGRRD
ncbi:hypothetical protein ALI144C_45005 [Actinosynnema sp. ALI-1.44]|nr:hypothetical protein ALI144C_45005 [Actinosynnema sp. ALI-1.44]